MDIAIVISAITGAVLSYAYLQDPMERHISLAVLGVFALIFAVLAVLDATEGRRVRRYGMNRRGMSELQLLGEDSSVTDTWDIYGKTSIVFGRDEGEFQVDVNLKNTDYAGTVDGEHAVMNYSGGSWYNTLSRQRERNTHPARRGREDVQGLLEGAVQGGAGGYHLSGARAG